MLVGWGMDTALFPSPMFSAGTRATLRPDGTAMVETSAADMGQGAWTSLAQVAADSLGLPLDQVAFRSGHSSLPDAGVAGGSGHTATAGGALYAAGGDVIRQMGQMAATQPDSPLFGAGNARFEAQAAASLWRVTARAATPSPTSSPAPEDRSWSARAARPAPTGMPSSAR